MITRVATTILATLALVGVIAGCSDQQPSVNRPLVMGAANTPQMAVLAQIYAGALRDSGTEVSSSVRIGDDRKLLDEMDSAQVDLFPAYTGRLLGQLAPELTPVTADDVYTDLNKSLPQGVSVGDATMVSATPQVFVATRSAEQTTGADLADCGRLTAGLPVLVVGAPDETVLREFTAAGCRFGPVESVPSSTEAAARIASGAAVGVMTPLDVAGDSTSGAAASSTAASGTAASTSGPQIRALPPQTPDTQGGAGATAVVGPRAQQLVPVYRTAAFSRDQVKTVNKVAGELTAADLATLTRRTLAGEHPSDLAGEWLAEHSL